MLLQIADDIIMQIYITVSIWMHVTEGQDQFHPLMGVAEIEGCIFNISDLPNDKKYDVMVQLLR